MYVVPSGSLHLRVDRLSPSDQPTNSPSQAYDSGSVLVASFTLPLIPTGANTPCPSPPLDSCTQAPGSGVSRILPPCTISTLPPYTQSHNLPLCLVNLCRAGIVFVTVILTPSPDLAQMRVSQLSCVNSERKSSTLSPGGPQCHLSLSLLFKPRCILTL